MKNMVHSIIMVLLLHFVSSCSKSKNLHPNCNIGLDCHTKTNWMSSPFVNKLENILNNDSKQNLMYLPSIIKKNIKNKNILVIDTIHPNNMPLRQLHRIRNFYNFNQDTKSLSKFTFGFLMPMNLYHFIEATNGFQSRYVHHNEFYHLRQKLHNSFNKIKMIPEEDQFKYSQSGSNHLNTLAELTLSTNIDIVISPENIGKDELLGMNIEDVKTYIDLYTSDLKKIIKDNKIDYISLSLDITRPFLKKRLEAKNIMNSEKIDDYVDQYYNIFYKFIKNLSEHNLETVIFLSMPNSDNDDFKLIKNHDDHKIYCLDVPNIIRVGRANAPDGLSSHLETNINQFLMVNDKKNLECTDIYVNIPNFTKNLSQVPIDEDFMNNISHLNINSLLYNYNSLSFTIDDFLLHYNNQTLPLAISYFHYITNVLRKNISPIQLASEIKNRKLQFIDPIRTNEFESVNEENFVKYMDNLCEQKRLDAFNGNQKSSKYLDYKKNNIVPIINDKNEIIATQECKHYFKGYTID